MFKWPGRSCRWTKFNVTVPCVSSLQYIHKMPITDNRSDGDLVQVLLEEEGGIEPHVSLSASDDGSHHVEGRTVVLSPQLPVSRVTM